MSLMERSVIKNAYRLTFLQFFDKRISCGYVAWLVAKRRNGAFRPQIHYGVLEYIPFRQRWMFHRQPIFDEKFDMQPSYSRIGFPFLPARSSIAQNHSVGSSALYLCKENHFVGVPGKGAADVLYTMLRIDARGYRIQSILSRMVISQITSLAFLSLRHDFLPTFIPTAIVVYHKSSGGTQMPCEISMIRFPELLPMGKTLERRKRSMRWLCLQEFHNLIPYHKNILCQSVELCATIWYGFVNEQNFYSGWLISEESPFFLFWANPFDLVAHP